MGVAENQKQLTVLRLLRRIGEIRQANLKGKKMAGGAASLGGYEQFALKALEDSEFVALADGTRFDFYTQSFNGGAMFTQLTKQAGKWGAEVAKKQPGQNWMGTSVIVLRAQAAEAFGLTNQTVFEALADAAAGKTQTNPKPNPIPMDGLAAGQVGAYDRYIYCETEQGPCNIVISTMVMS